MSFAKALAATITIASLVLTPVAASAQNTAYYLDDKNVPDDMPRPSGRPDDNEKVWRCDKNDQTGKWMWPCGYVYKKQPQATAPRVAQNDYSNGDHCNSYSLTCDLPVGKAPSLDNTGTGPRDENWRKEDPNCVYANPNATFCRWINKRLEGTVPDVQRAQLPGTPPQQGYRPRTSILGAVVTTLLVGTFLVAVYEDRGNFYYQDPYYNGTRYIPVPAAQLYGCHRRYPVRCQ